MVVSYASIGNINPTVALAILQSQLPGSEIDFDRHTVKINAAGKSTAEVLEVIRTIPGTGNLYWHDGNRPD